METDAIELPTVVKFLLVPLLGAAYFGYRSAEQGSKDLTLGPHKEFMLLQGRYFLPYFMAIFSDWLQSPYNVYKLCTHYGYAQEEVIILYIAGFVASVTFGTAAGSLADKYGRKKLSIAFCLLYSLSCLTKLSDAFDVLVVGQVLGGISTSILFSVFESWYIHEHTMVCKYPMEWISITFSKATFFNGPLAIAAAIVTEIGSETMNLGPVAPFLTAIPLLSIVAVLIYKTWDENLGLQEGNWRGQCREGLRTILRNRNILMLSLIQSAFESCIYIFVFMWAAVLEAGSPRGLAFSSYMVAIMIGSSVYSRLLSRGVKSEKILTFCLSITFFFMLFCGLLAEPSWRNADVFIYLGFLFEISVGIYFPAIGYVRGETIPEGMRANVMSWFRVPMSIINCGGLVAMHFLDSAIANLCMFLGCGCVAVCGWILAVKFARRMRRSMEVAKEDLLAS